MNKTERRKLRQYSNVLPSVLVKNTDLSDLLDYVDTLEAARRFVVGCDCTVCKDNREALNKGK